MKREPQGQRRSDRDTGRGRTGRPPKPQKPARAEAPSRLPSPAQPAVRKPAKRRASPTTALEETHRLPLQGRRPARSRADAHLGAGRRASRAGSYQRLEFLGDHVLGLVISDMLFRAFPKADEGELSRRLADLVRKETCADVARAIDLGAALRLGASEANAGGRLRTAILADVCEALVGAVFLDGGYEAAAALIERLWGERMRAPVRPLRDPKTMLQEWAQARGLPTPTYQEVERTGPHHDPEFRVAVTLPQREPAEGVGRSKRVAEQAAAAAMLKREGVRRIVPMADAAMADKARPNRPPRAAASSR